MKRTAYALPLLLLIAALFNAPACSNDDSKKDDGTAGSSGTSTTGGKGGSSAGSGGSAGKTSSAGSAGKGGSGASAGKGSGEGGAGGETPAEGGNSNAGAGNDDPMGAGGQHTSNDWYCSDTGTTCECWEDIGQVGTCATYPCCYEYGNNGNDGGPDGERCDCTLDTGEACFAKVAQMDAVEVDRCPGVYDF